MKPVQLLQIGYWLNEIEQGTIAQALYDHANEALCFFGPAVAFGIDKFEMRQACMRKMNGDL